MIVYKMDVLEDVLITVALILIGWEWWHSFARKRWTVSLIIATVECLWWLLALLWGGALGPDYSNLHFFICAGNVAGALIAAIVAAAFRSQRSLRVFVASVSLAAVWFFALAIMYVV
ncbi:MAG TPA: hypothetical protein VK819_18875 [Acidobacteriaceae bacterium]|jgi:hypothetical protein|nr:hypothetical protein [Acidobacteriaceae bacterium]